MILGLWIYTFDFEYSSEKRPALSNLANVEMSSKSCVSWCAILLKPEVFQAIFTIDDIKTSANIGLCSIMILIGGDILVESYRVLFIWMLEVSDSTGKQKSFVLPLYSQVLTSMTMMSLYC